MIPHRLPVVAEMCYLGFVLVMFPLVLYAQNIVVDHDDGEPQSTKLVLPYILATESLEFAVGLGGGTGGYIQPQTSLFITAFASSNDSRALFVSLHDYQLPFAKRFFIGFTGSVGDYTDQREYTGFNASYPGEHAGSNDSDPDNFIRGAGEDDWYDLKLKYLLPIGHGEDTIINRSTLKHGLLVSGQTGGDVWNPMISGRTNLELTTFKRHREIIDENGLNVGDSEGITLSLEYDNRDFYQNPTKGSLQKITAKHDFGVLEGTDRWSVFQLDLRKYFYLGSSDTFKQKVLATNYWTSYTRTWQPAVDEQGMFIDGRPPNSLGSSLGGFDRLRSYPVNRYSDKAAVYYSAELRLIPHWNPLGNMKLLKPLAIDWWQFVPFVEVGRVAPHWSFSNLHEDIRTVFGLGLRVMAQRSVFRLDTAYSEDSWSIYAMVGHPF